MPSILVEQIIDRQIGLALCRSQNLESARPQGNRSPDVEHGCVCSSRQQRRSIGHVQRTKELNVVGLWGGGLKLRCHLSSKPFNSGLSNGPPSKNSRESAGED